MSSTLTKVKIAGHGEFSASEAAMARFESMSKDALTKTISEGYGGDPAKGGKPLHSAKHFRQFPKADLVVMAADMFGQALRRAGQQAADMEPSKPAEAPLRLNGVLTDTEQDEIKLARRTGPDHDTRDREGAEEPADLDNGGTDEGINDVSEDYPGQRITGPESVAPATAGPVADAPATPKKPTSRDEAPNGYRLKAQGGWLRRDQPRKPGDIAKYVLVTDVTKATVIKTRHQVDLKLAEAGTLLPAVPAQIEVVR